MKWTCLEPRDTGDTSGDTFAFCSALVTLWPERRTVEKPFTNQGLDGLHR